MTPNILSRLEASADELLGKLQAASWISILKALPFDGGPSSTRWVFLGVFFLVSFVVSLTQVAIVAVFLWRRDVNIALLGFNSAILTAILKFAMDAHTRKHEIDAAQREDETPTA